MKDIKWDLKREKYHKGILPAKLILKLDKKKCLRKNMYFKIGFKTIDQKKALEKYEFKILYLIMIARLESEQYYLKTCDIYQKILNFTKIFIMTKPTFPILSLIFPL